MAFDKMGAKNMQKKRITQSLSVLVVFSTLLMVEQADRAAAFVQTTLSPGLQQNGCSFGNNAITSISKHPEPSCFAGSMRSNTINRRQSTELYSFMGSDGGLFGIGTPELVSQTFIANALSKLFRQSFLELNDKLDELMCLLRFCFSNL